jgi:hypothetical protein
MSIHTPDVSSAIFVSRFEFSGDVVERVGAVKEVGLRKKMMEAHILQNTWKNWGAHGGENVQKWEREGTRERGGRGSKPAEFLLGISFVQLCYTGLSPQSVSSLDALPNLPSETISSVNLALQPTA